MSTPEQRKKMGAHIVDFEARRDQSGRIRVYSLPVEDGGGAYEVAGINDKYHPEAAARLRSLVEAGNQQQAEEEAAEYIAKYTDRVADWTKSAAVECYLRDCAFNRGAGGAAKILQIALGVGVDGGVGPTTKGALAEAEKNPAILLEQLRAARETYERDYIGYRQIFWEGLTNRWNKAFAFAKTFL
jgi:lysozyme family protein